MRISTFEETAGMGEHARKQIAKALTQQPISNIKRVGSASDLRKDAPDPSVAEKPKKKIKRASRVLSDPVTGLKFCEWPSPDPGVWLHELLNKHFGAYCDGGDHAHEVIINGYETKVRYDHLLFGMIFIEFDGFSFHKHLANFKSDRKKQKHALVNGFILHRLTRDDLVNHYDEVIPNILAMLEHFPKYNMEIEPVGKTQCKIVGRTKR